MKSTFFRRFSRNKGALGGLVVLALVALVALAAPWLVSHDPFAMVDRPFLRPLTEPGMPLGSDATGIAGRRLCIIAATEQSLGHSELALAAAREAEAVAPQLVLPKVQQALLHEQWLKDPDAAKAAWGRVLSEARTSGDLSDLIQSMRARVVLERLDAGVPSAKPAH